MNHDLAPLTPAQEAAGRSRLYGLLARLYRRAPDGEMWTYVRAIPALAEVLPDQPGDAAAAAYEALFGFNVAPYQAIFLDPSGLLGGPETSRVDTAYARTGYQAAPGDGDDHIAAELDFLAFLAAAEADAWEDDLPATAGRIQAQQAQFLAEHLLRWLGPLMLTVERLGTPLYARLATLTVELVADHVDRLALTGEAFTPLDESLHFTDEQTDLRAMVAYLLQPPSCGLYLTRDDLRRLGRAFDLPHGFGTRRQLMGNLLHAAATYRQLPALLEALAAEADQVSLGYSALGGRHPQLLPWLTDWQMRAAATAAGLREAANAAQAAANQQEVPLP